jgi:dTDP-4-dehydrorhamnose reductase
VAKILVLGATGQVGYELVRTLAPLGEVVAPTRDQVNLSEPSSFDFVVLRRPDIVVNAAADTAVDRAESHFEECRRANAVGPTMLAEACQSVGARLIHYSTDYVFDGASQAPYLESDPTSPVNAYGRAKLEGESGVLAADPRHLVLRLSWIYSWRGRNFALTMLRLAREGKPIRVVDDQVGSPTYAPDIAGATAGIVSQLIDRPTEPGGLHHLTSSGQTSWCGFARALLREALGDDAPPVEPIPTEAFPTPAARPRYSVLSNDRIRERFGIQMPNWEEALSRWCAAL